MGKQELPSFDRYWPVIEPLFLKLLHQEAVAKAKWHDLFVLAHEVCLWDLKGCTKLHSNLQKLIESFLQQVMSNVFADQEDQALLKAYTAEWRKFFTQCTYLPVPFSEIEISLGVKTAYNVKKNTKQGEKDIRRMMLNSWNKIIFSNIKQRLQNSAMRLVCSERNGEAFDSQLVIDVRESFVNLCSNSQNRLEMYHENFEKPYIEAAEAFYRVKAPEYFAANGVQNYICYAYQKLKEEEQMGLKYLEPCSDSIQALRECCARCLIDAFEEHILTECSSFIRNNDAERLQAIFRLMDQIPEGISPIQKCLEQYIVQQGLADMFSNAGQINKDCARYVELLLDLFTKFSKLIKEVFNDDPRFLTSRDKAFKRIVNDASVFRLELPSLEKCKTQPESRCPELLANCCDMLLRKTPLSKKLISDEIESRLKDIILVLKYVQNKDVFMRYYKVHLTRRLILDSSPDSEKEENMVGWLRDVGMPADYINKLARMFQDVKVSKDLNQQIKDSHIHKGTFADSINIKILNVGAWARGSERVQVSLPLELEDFIPGVEDYYKQKHNGRKLQWYHHMSNGTITFSNKVGKFDLDVTTFQIAVLFAWNERPYDRISFEDLRLATELPDAELRRTMWSLVNFPKIKQQLLLCVPEVKTPKEFDDSTLFWVNQEFCLIRNGKIQKRGKLNLVGRLQLSTEKSKEEDNASIVQLRILRIQEAIVQIMKMRKQATIQQLQIELVKILKNMFLPSKQMIKEQIEWLVEHDYMKREKNRNHFIYVA
ncbi:hypothetical protein CDAR_272011 [Caerostris darwini]|uniref:Cullin-5 n=1 Tax=Caerostris darwini TaxID=1538125 RepID=A0AAV4W8P3_9ARAC|nr:hypothetical protein CDAR_272011 [Caerostris darwini]